MGIPNQLPLIPFIHNSQDIIFFFLVLARVGGIFLISPLLSHNSIKMQLRSFLTVMTTILLAMTLYSDYRGPQPLYYTNLLDSNAPISLILLGMGVAKELAIGFLIGFCFALVMEALVVAGQLVGVMIGFSIAEILDPVSGVSQSMISNLLP
jgi:flagellar biosynthetic protein FliR